MQSALRRFGYRPYPDRVVITSDRRVAAWGALRANWNYLKVGARWGLGFRKRLEGTPASFRLLQRLIDHGIATGYMRGRTVQRTSG